MWNKFCFRLALLLALSGCCTSITIIRDVSGDRVVDGIHCESGKTLFQGRCIKDANETDCLLMKKKNKNSITLLTKETFNETMEVNIGCHTSSLIEPSLSLEDGANGTEWKNNARSNDMAIFHTIGNQRLEIRFKEYFPGILLRVQLKCRNPLPSFTDKNGCVIVRFNGSVKYPLPKDFPPLPTSKPTTPVSTTTIKTTTLSTTPVSTASTTEVTKPDSDEVDGKLSLFIGVGIGAVLLVAVLVILVVLLRRRRKSIKNNKGHKYTSNDDRTYEDIDTVNSQHNNGKTGEHSNEPNIYQYASTNEAIRPVYQNQNGFEEEEFLQNNQADYAQVSKSNENYEMVPQYSDPKVENKPSRPNFPPNIDYSSEYDIPIQEEEKEIPEYAAVQKKVKK